MSYYAVSSVQTDHYIVTTSREHAGDRVVTVPGPGRDPTTTFVRINPPLGGSNSIATVQGNGGLYIAVESDETGQYLVWSSTPHPWNFMHKGPQGTFSINVPGHNLDWFDELGVGPHIILKPGRDATESQIFFSVVPIFG